MSFAAPAPQSRQPQQGRGRRQIIFKVTSPLMPPLRKKHACPSRSLAETVSNGRTPERIAYHYHIEKELADRLRRASRTERSHLYSQVYDELFRRVRDHPMLVRRQTNKTAENTDGQLLRLVLPFLTRDTVFLEIGPGDCNLAIAVCSHVKRVYAVDVSREITKGVTPPDNFTLLTSDGRSVPVPTNSITLAFSNQLIEHLHPEDAREQTANVLNALKPGGAYICLTPNRLAGPHDISRYFDETATGLHLKEYTTSDLTDHFRQIGFSRVRAMVRVKGFRFLVPTQMVIAIEKTIAILPPRIQKPFARTRLIGALIDVCLVATK